ncbi:MAG: M23 family metallopeptidase [Clostridium sp.]|uniref:M23 family metallopeptidase n=1 Tax=Clostridium sp. TaxID=1506 RepID=UPI002901ED50|nr:M23 family metallopeptidase [Clostridium sp.]MDU1232621.1 M23 family metallopeptidase [Clostridium sp.]
MDKNFKQKLKDLMSRDGFYIALFLCLCVVVTVGTFSYKKFSAQNQANKIQETSEDDSYNTDDNNEVANANNQIPNAERVENSVTNEESKNNNKEDKQQNKDSNKSTVVSTNNSVNFVVPLNGVESRNYTYPKPVQVGENVFRTIKGVNLEAKIGTEVKAVADGVVDLVENSGVEEGIVVEIKHANGLKTRYGNLDENTSVKQGDKVTANQVIGKVGDTAKVYSSDVFGEFLNLQVINANGEQVNPESYFTFSK